MRKELSKKNNPLLILRIGYMKRYDGPGEITGGGAFVDARGVGGEVYNFKPSHGKCYGYAMSRHGGGINLKYLDDGQSWRRGDSLESVDIVFISKRPGFGQVVVGWYLNATVFHKEYRVRRGKILGMDSDRRHYLCVADARAVKLLPDAMRTFEVPYAPAGHKGFPGQSNVWYPQHHSKQSGVNNFIKQLRKYISSAKSKALPPDEDTTKIRKAGRGGKRKPDHAHNAMVEAAAVEVAWSYYESAGYTVKSVEAENRGWDLVTRKGLIELLVEVKGISGPTVAFELTPNEYKKLNEISTKYRVCVVCNVLTAPRLYELSPILVQGIWELISKKDLMRVPLRERIAAIGVEVAPEQGRR